MIQYNLKPLHPFPDVVQWRLCKFQLYVIYADNVFVLENRDKNGIESNKGMQMTRA